MLIKWQTFAQISHLQIVKFAPILNWAPAGLIGVNLWPQEPNRRYLLCPRSMFCEFLPESSVDEETPQTLLMEEVKEGESYELVITNAAGLFRSGLIHGQTSNLCIWL